MRTTALDSNRFGLRGRGPWKRTRNILMPPPQRAFSARHPFPPLAVTPPPTRGSVLPPPYRGAVIYPCPGCLNSSLGGVGSFYSLAEGDGSSVSTSWVVHHRGENKCNKSAPLPCPTAGVSSALPALWFCFSWKVELITQNIKQNSLSEHMFG